MSEPPRKAGRQRRAQFGLIGFVALLSSAVLVFGWLLGVEALIRVRPGFPAMVPPTAVGFILICTATVLAIRDQKSATRILLALLAVLVMFEIAAWVPDDFREILDLDGVALATELSFVLLGISVFYLHHPGPNGAFLTSAAATAVGVISVVTLFSYLFNPISLAGVALFANMAIHTAASMFLLATALLIEKAERNWLRHIIGPGRGSQAARRLCPAVIAGQLLLCLAAYVLTETGAIEADFRLTLLAVALTATSLLAILRSAALDNAAELRERDQEIRLTALIDALDAAIFVFDDAGTVQFTNQRARDWAQDEGAASAARWLSDLELTDAGTSRPLSRQELEGLRPWETLTPGETVVARNLSEDGQRQILLATPGRWAEAGGQNRHLLMLRDITEEATAAQARQKAERVGILGEIAGGIAHDVANLLGAIRLSADVGTMQPLPELAMAQFEAIQAACDRGTELTSRVLSFAGRGELNIGPIDLGELMPTVASFAKRTLPAKVDIALDMPDGPLIVEAEPGLLESALLNLIVNARNAIVEGGKGSRISLSARAVGDRVTIFVADDGPGMPAHVLERAREAFFTTRSDAGGTGLGLATVQRCADSAGGEFGITSAPGQGTVVELTLSRLAAMPETGVPAPAPDISGATILAIEDDAAFRKGVTDILTAAGARVIGVDTGDKGLAELHSAATSVDLVLTDLQLPGQIDGREVVRYVRANRPDLPVIILSGIAGERFPASAGDRIVKLRKPIGARDLLAAVAAALDGKS